MSEPEDKKDKEKAERLDQLCKAFTSLGEIAANSTMPAPAKESFARYAGGAACAAESLRDIKTAEMLAKSGASEAARTTYLKVLADLDPLLKQERLKIMLGLAQLKNTPAEAKQAFNEVIEFALNLTENPIFSTAWCRHTFALYLARVGEIGEAEELFLDSISALEAEEQKDEYTRALLSSIQKDFSKLLKELGRIDEALEYQRASKSNWRKAKKLK